ncbi:MAG TPA: hypothetical protein VNJ12_10065, partial [Candidatus Dormibacteraeota bacterium]|nr:hypothetical protein [Candidatus Dormibacteraeota bacterium]
AQNLTVHYLWDLPTPFQGGFAGKVTKGWQLGGVVTAQTGLPFTPLIAGDPLGLGDTAAFAYPNRIRGGSCSSLTNPGNVANYIKTQCFALPTAPATLPSGVNCIPFSSSLPNTCSNLLGNGGRNEIYGPGITDVDFSVVKDTKIRENLTLQFRAEMFNLFNHPNFKPPVDNSTIFNSDGSPAGNAGTLDATSIDPREIQFAVKVLF